MKKLSKIMAVILVIWSYLLLFLVLGNGDKYQVGKIPLLVLAIITAVINIVTIISTFSRKDDYKSLALTNMILKILMIPIYIMVVLLVIGGSFVLLITAIGILFIPLVIAIAIFIDYFLLVTTSFYGLTSIRIINRNNLGEKSTYNALAVCHFFFVIDVIASIILYIKVRKIGK